MNDFDDNALGAGVPLPPASAPDSSVSPAVSISTALIPVRPQAGRTPLTLEKLTRMKEMYMGFETLDVIAETLHMSTKSVARQVHKQRANSLTWAQVREEQRRLVSESIMSNSSHLLQQATDKSIRLLHIGLTNFHRQATIDPSSVELKDLEKIAGIAERLDRLNRLAAGKATSIVSLASGEATPKEITDKIISEDPFTNAEFSEVKDADKG